MKKSFTLIEVIISIIIFSLLVLFMSNVVSSIKTSISTLEKEYNKNIKNSYLIKTLYADILNRKKIDINSTKNYSVVYLQTSNSLYNIPMPYVVWYVSKKDNALIRLESPKKIKLPTKDGYLDLFKKRIKIFRIYKNKDKFFIFIKGDKKLFFGF